jgi:hypothetical protein
VPDLSSTVPQPTPEPAHKPTPKPTATSQVLAAVLTAAAGWAAQTLVRRVWVRRNGVAPRSASDPNVSAVAAVAFTAIAATVGAIAQRTATRTAERVAAKLLEDRRSGGSR